MIDETRQHLEEQRKIYIQRLRIRERQAATFGDNYVPPHIEMEIAQTRSEIEKIDTMLAGMGKTSFEPADLQTTILFLSADPVNAPRLSLGREFREIQDQLRASKFREQFKLESRMSVRPTDISRAMLDVRPKIVHFSGHGSSHGELCFEDQAQIAQTVQPDALADLFQLFAGQVKCVLLNACYSEIQGNAIARHIEYVIGMSHAVGDDAAIAFSIGFYQALGAGEAIENAYKFGCVQIEIFNIPEHLTPVLIKRQ
jgi:hypothetical protein